MFMNQYSNKYRSKATSRANTAGFTLVEISMVVAILAIITGTLFMLLYNSKRTVAMLDAKTVAQDNARTVLMVVARELRQAKTGLDNLIIPVSQDSLSYFIATDVNGNGWPVDSEGKVEFSELRTIQVDVDDANEDGVTLTQLVRIEDIAGSEEKIVKVLTSNLAPANGISFELEGVNSSSITITVTCAEVFGYGENTIELTSTMTETVTARNEAPEDEL